MCRMSRMTTFHFQTHVSDNGMIALPLMPETFHGEDVTVRIDINAKQQCDSFLDIICGGWNDDSRTTEEIIREIYESRTVGREIEPL